VVVVVVVVAVVVAMAAVAVAAVIFLQLNSQIQIIAPSVYRHFLLTCSHKIPFEICLCYCGMQRLLYLNILYQTLS
jgi:hypothetical protein